MKLFCCEFQIHNSDGKLNWKIYIYWTVSVAFVSKTTERSIDKISNCFQVKNYSNTS